VNLNEFFILPTYQVWSYGSHPKTVDQTVSEKISAFFGSDRLATIIKGEKTTIQAKTTCIARFFSSPMESRGVCIEHSILVICWFTDDIDRPIRNLLIEGLAGVDWENHAEDTHSEW
jgi:hypothetical protein